MMDFSQACSFSLKMLIDGLEWCALLVMFLSAVLTLILTAPFTAEHPLVSKWCNATFLQICSDEETNSSTFSAVGVNYSLSTLNTFPQ